MAAAGAPVRAPVAVALRVLGLSGQAYYPWLKDPVSPRDGDDADVTDVLYDLHADDGTLGYIWAVKDVWSNKIVGYSIDIRMKSSLARAAMRNAIALRSPHGTICHSDRDGQLRAERTQNLLRNNGLIGSTGRS
ncbi:integrase catalytic domain-containing protein [Microbacterium testaceum]|uniref:integrase catalytic domain-containing protein n=1 Tax=Microbacterium testaceum TaxID=2033 RepID=UPI0009BDAF4C|nr:DDE-type integrase/transposase/recombinase [Microbacterium testaceum]